jgi:hypothetical protein
MFAPTKKVATTITDGTVLNTSWRLPNGAAVPSADRGVFFVDVNISRTTFLEQMEVAAPSITNYATGTTAGLALDESAGSFDHLSLFWDRTTPEFEICDIAVSRLA